MTSATIHFGITGPGMIAEFHAKAIAAIPDAALVAVHGRNADKVASFSERHECVGFTDYDEFLRHAPLDVVCICTPSGAHLEPGIAAAKAGRHVVCEKPLEVTVDRADRLIAACRDAGVMLTGIFPRRFNPATHLLKQALADGRFGRVAMADAYIKWWRTQAYYDSGAWRGTWALDGGGALMNQAIHTVDLLLHVAGDVKSVRGETRLLAHKDIEVEDAATALLEFESGALGVIQASTACWSEAGHPAEIQICGDAGSVIMTDDKFRAWEFRDAQPEDDKIRRDFGLGAGAGGAGAADPSAIDFTWHQRNLEDAIHAIRTGAPPYVDGREARRSVALIRAIYDSAAKGGERVEVER